MKSAADCAESECSVDEIADLVSELKEQQKEMEDRMTKVMNMIAHLEHVNEKEERKTDEVRQFVKDMLRVFKHDVSLWLMGTQYQSTYKFFPVSQ